MERSQLKIGMHVTLNTDYYNVKKGTEGVLVNSASTWPRMDSVSIQWNRYPRDTLISYFSYEQLQFLDAT